MLTSRLRNALRATPAPRAALALLLVLLVCGLLVQWIGSDITLLRDPLNASVSEDDYRQYLVGWSSGAGVKEVVQFVRQRAAANTERPILLVVGGFGRHGSWAVAPRLRDVAGVRVQPSFVDTATTVRNLVDAARTQRIWVLEEPPVYSMPPALLADVSPAPRIIFNFDRQMPRLGKTDGGLRIVEFSALSRVKGGSSVGPPVDPNDPPTIESVTNPNGLEGTSENRFFWLGGGAAAITVRSGKPTTLEIAANFRPGPSFAGPMERRLLVRTSGDFEEALTVPPGPGRIRVPIPAGRTVVRILALDPANQPTNPNSDPRPMIVGFSEFKTSFGPSPKDQSPTLGGVSCALEFASGAYNEEKIGKTGGWFRWTNGDLRLRLFSSRAATAVLSGQYLSMVRPETITVLFEEQKVGSIEVSASQEAILPFAPLQLRLPAGESTLTFRANKGGIRPSGDSRSLNFGLANLTMRVEQSKGSCTLR